MVRLDFPGSYFLLPIKAVSHEKNRRHVTTYRDLITFERTHCNPLTACKNATA
ncbi:MAG: hypothetical protein J6I50_11460 [Clostridia bacterium]|nr:hypothetical protein [Clostridia bacterium]